VAERIGGIVRQPAVDAEQLDRAVDLVGVDVADGAGALKTNRSIADADWIARGPMLTLPWKVRKRSASRSPGPQPADDPDCVGAFGLSLVTETTVIFLPLGQVCVSSMKMRRSSLNVRSSTGSSGGR
jgi:hypothetical protein